MNIRSRIPDQVERIRYADESGGRWDPLEVQIPVIGEQYEGCEGVLVCYPLSKTDHLHSTVLVGKKCKGGIWSKEITIGNTDEIELVEGWSVRHKKTAEVRQSVEEKRKALEEVICCGNTRNGHEELEKSLLFLKDVDYYHENIHAFKLCFELFIKEPDGTITLWDRITTNLCTEVKTAKDKKHTDVQTIPRIPAEHPELPISLGCDSEKQKSDGSIQSSRFSQPDDTELLNYDFVQDLLDHEPVENNVPFEYRQNINSGALQGNDIPVVVQEYDEPMEVDVMQPEDAGDGYDQNLEVKLLGRKNPAESSDLHSDYPEQLLKTSVSGDGLSSSALFTAALEHAQVPPEHCLDGCTLMLLDSGGEDYIYRNRVEDINYEIQKLEEILHIDTTPSYEPVIDDGRLYSGCSSTEPGFISLPTEESGAPIKWKGFPPGRNICDAPHYTDGYQTQTWEKEFTAGWSGVDLFQFFPVMRSSNELGFY